MKLTIAAFLALLFGAASTVTAQLPQPPNPWGPPIGIPAPPFGITQTAGAPTHYVDNTNPSATDVLNSNGTATRPRLTVPTSLPAGSVVEVKGGPYPTGSVSWSAQGSAAAPVFIKGVGMPVFTASTSASRIAAAGAYFIIEGIVMDRMSLAMASNISHFAFRRSIVRNYSPSGNSAAIAPAGSDVVFFGNEVHNNGDPASTVEIDVHGFKPDTGAQRIWIIDNHIHHNGGDSVQIGSSNSLEPWAQRIYIGRNTIHEDRENGVDIKRARDIIVSHNAIYGYRPTSTSGGESIVTHDGAQRVWIVGNLVAGSAQGIVSTGASGYYVIGNAILNIAHVPGDPTYDPNNVYRTAGILTYNTTDSVHVNNTLWGVDAGISYAAGTASTEIANNIVANLLQPSFHIAIGNSAAAAVSRVSNNLLDAAPRVRIGSAVSGCQAFPNCINADPLLVDPANASFELKPGSRAIDAGMTHPIYAAFQSLYGVTLAVDRKGTPRPYGAAWDIGAFEFTGSAPAPPKNLRIIR